MTHSFVVAGVLFLALPAAAQSRVYTNADLSSRAGTLSPPRTPEDAVRILKASRSIVDRTEAGTFAIDPGGPRVDILPHDRYWPFDGPPPRVRPSVADGWWGDPVSAYALQHPIEAAYGVSWPRRAARPPAPRLTRPVPAVPVVAPPVSPAVGRGAGVRRR